jgi:hypothetical protein
MERSRESKTAKSLSGHIQCIWKHFPPFNFDTIGGILIHWLLHHTVLLWTKGSIYEILALQAHAFTLTCYFYRLNVITSHLIVHKEGLGYLSVCAVASRSSPPSLVCICNGHPGSELWCARCKLRNKQVATSTRGNTQSRGEQERRDCPLLCSFCVCILSYHV